MAIFSTITRGRNYIDACQRKQLNGGPYTQRYIGSMVADCIAT